MDAPLTLWYCDTCGLPITDASHGMLEWTRDAQPRRHHTFRIVHNPAFSASGNCYRNEDRDGRSDWHLSWATGPDGFTRLLGLAVQPIMMPPRTAEVEAGSFLEIVARLHVPYYEEARRCYADPTVRDWLAAEGVVDQGLRADIARAAIEYAEAECIVPCMVPAPA